MMSLPAKQWFHVSCHDCGPQVVMRAKVPHAPATGEDRATPRVCFSPTIEGAMRGKAGGYPAQGVFNFFKAKTHYYDLCEGLLMNPAIYAPLYCNLRRADVPDFTISQEHISLIDVDCIRIGYASMASLFDGRFELCSNPFDPLPQPFMNETGDQIDIELYEMNLWEVA